MAASEKTITVELEGRTVPVLVRRNKRAKRVMLKVDAVKRCAVVVLPKRVTEKYGLAFLHRRADWVLQRIAVLPKPVVYRNGIKIPFFGQTLTIHHRPEARRGVWVQDGGMFVSGRIEHLPRRVDDYIKKRAKEIISIRVGELAQQTCTEVRKITVRDTKSRWGSCSAKAGLNFSFRLAFAPAYVCEYVIIHEICHLGEMNHSQNYWNKVYELMPHADKAKLWLKKYGIGLHRYGKSRTAEL